MLIPVFHICHWCRCFQSYTFFHYLYGVHQGWPIYCRIFPLYRCLYILRMFAILRFVLFIFNWPKVMPYLFSVPLLNLFSMTMISKLFVVVHCVSAGVIFFNYITYYLIFCLRSLLFNQLPLLSGPIRVFHLCGSIPIWRRTYKCHMVRRSMKD